MKVLFLDYETRSEADLTKVGAHRYAQDPTTEVLLLAWAVDGGPVHVDEEVSDELFELLCRPDIMKVAHNAEFDMAVTKYVVGVDIDVWQWHDTAYQAAYFGYPRALKALAEMLDCTRKAANEEMLLFSSPVKSRKKNAPITWCTKETHPNEWENFKAYAAQDVLAMRECYLEMPKLIDSELFVMHHTFQMNFEGIPFDMELANKILKKSEEYSAEAGQLALAIYGVQNLRSVPQMKAALEREGVFLESLNAKERNGVEHPLLELRDKACGSVFSKIKKAELRICFDGRLRGEFVGYGAHTGRWSSRGVQFQNFARITSEVNENLENVRDYAHLKQHMRLCINSGSPAQDFVCADLSQIEARVVAWLAGCEWRMEVFKNGEDIYARSAERIFGIPHVTKDSPYRQQGKYAELSLGFGGAVGAMQRFAPDFCREQGEENILKLVQSWRRANPEICRLWRLLEDAFHEAVQRGVCVLRLPYTTLTFRATRRVVTIELPNGHTLYYRDVRGHTTGDLVYTSYSKGHGTMIQLWGSIFIENIAQAIARDVLVDIMARVGIIYPEYKCVGTVHDEVWYITDDPKALDNLLIEMARPIEWAKGLITKGDGLVSKRYIK